MDARDGGVPADGRQAPADVLAPPAEPAELATWGRRVVATLLDDLLIAGVAYLAATGQQGVGPGVLSPAPVWGGTAEPGNAWLLGTFVAVLVMQAYLGSTPGKLVMGLAVVSEHDGRPVGLLRTAGRWLLHLLDAILLIGYLRPLWHPARQTFADSLVGTVALRTRAPLPHPWLGRGPATAEYLAPPSSDAAALPRQPWVAPAGLLLNRAGPAPRWRRGVTVAAGVACLLGAGFAVGPGQGWSDQERAWCQVAAPADRPLRLMSASVGLQPGYLTESRLGVERRRSDDQDPGVHAGWGWDGTVPADDVVLRLTLRGEDGAPERVIDHVSRQGVVVSGPGTPVGDHSTEVLLPLSTLEGLGDDWTWEATMVVDGEVLPGCRGPAPPV